MDKKRIGVVGCGQWGPNHIRNFFFHPQTEVKRICDKSPERLSANQSLYPGVAVTTDYREITRAPDVDAVIVATPVSSHYEIVKDALEHSKDVLCEKPLTARSEECRELTALAAAKQRVLMVGHVFLFNPGIRKLKELLQQKVCGRHFYLYGQRTNLGPVRRDVNAVYDLAAHDISIFNFLLEGTPRVITASGHCYLQRGVEDVAFVSLEYPGGIAAHIHVSWLDPRKVRQITVVGEKKMITWDDMKPSGPVEIFSKHVETAQFYKDYGEFQLLVKEGETVTPHVANAEPLKLQTEHFVDCISRRSEPISGGRSALDVIETLEAIDAILAPSRQHDTVSSARAR